ncbi:hypothetical protein H8356DRAFT_15517 [Neocallimastix lanati (nom. inval.)]|nr:hypothetical protein H8356DRAFT_15517 [Neocallimastix sp. JGI-2020a]
MSDINVNDNETLKSLIKTCFILDNPPPLLKDSNLNDMKAEAHLKLGQEYLKLGQSQKALSEVNISISILEKIVPIKNNKNKRFKNKENGKDNLNENENNQLKNVKDNEVQLIIQCYEIAKEIYETQGKTIMIQNMQNRINKVKTLYLKE